MHFPSLRGVVATLGVAALAACAGHGAILPAQTAVDSPQASTLSAMSFSNATAPVGTDLTPMASSPCNIKGIWYFTGACAAFYMPKAGGTLALKAFQGLTLSIGFSKNNAGKKVAFIVGDGTSDQNITGTFQGKKFPVYGSVPCVDTSGKKAACAGKGLLYTEVINASSQSVTFSAVPAIQIADTKKFPGTKQCQLDLLQFTSKGNVWMLLPDYAKPASGKVTFPALKATLTFPKTSLGVFGVTCQ